MISRVRISRVSRVRVSVCVSFRLDVFGRYETQVHVCVCVRKLSSL